MVARIIALGLALGPGIGSAAAAGPPSPVMTRDVPGGTDHPLIGRYQGSVLVAFVQKAFDEVILAAGPAKGATFDADHAFSATVSPQGRVTRALYLEPEGRSTLEVSGNYADALKRQGLEQVYTCVKDECGQSFVMLEYGSNQALIAPRYDQDRIYTVKAAMETVIDPRYTLFKRNDPGGDTYVAIYVAQNRGGTFGNASGTLDGHVFARTDIVEPRAMDSKITTVSATTIADTLSSQGHVAFYGIFFDFNKAEVKPESDPQLMQMASYIKAHASDRVYITGHTDNQGGLEYNIDLSQRRADAVAKALVTRFGIASKYIATRGLASLAPLASNATEEGRAKNRRVEMVGG